MGDATKLDIVAWDRDFRINVTSMVLMARHVIPEMRKIGRGSVVNMASVSGREYRTNLRTYLLTERSARRKPQLTIPNQQGCRHSDDTRNGGAARTREYPRELCLPGHGFYANGKGPWNDGRDAPETHRPESFEAGGYRMGRRLRHPLSV